MPRIPDEFKDEVKARYGSKLVGLIRGGGVQLKPQGSHFRGRCPFHDDSDPSFVVCNGDMGWHYMCYGCKVIGDAYSWLIDRQGMEFNDAVEYLAGLEGMPVPGSTPEQRKLDEHLNRLRDIVNRTSTWFQQRLYLPDADGVRAYAAERGLSEQDSRDFMIGYAPPFLPNPKGRETRQWQDFIADLMTTFRFSREELVSSGVFQEDRRGGTLRPFFSDRLMFTICDYRGRPIGFAGRSLDDANKEISKYINTGDTALFRKGQILYNEHRARKQTAGTSRDVVAVEGYMDAIKVDRAGWPVVCVMGTAVTPGQIEAIFRIRGRDPANVPVFCFDGDRAGRDAAAKVSRLLLPVITPTRYARIAMLFDAHDPASVLALPNGKESLQGAIDDAVAAPLILFDEEVRAHQPLATPESRAAFKRAVSVNILGQIADQELRSGYKDDFYQRQREMFITPPPFVARRPVRGSMPETPACVGESAALAALLNHPELFHEMAEDLSRVTFSGLENQKREIIHLMSTVNTDDEVRSMAATLADTPSVGDRIFLPMLEHSAPFVSPGASVEDARTGITAILRGMEAAAIRQRIEQRVERLMASAGSPDWHEKLREVSLLLSSLGGDGP